MLPCRKPHNFLRFIHSDDNNRISISIPNKFIREHRKNILLNNVLIIVSDDKVWSLDWMISGDGKLWLQKGWPEFSEHYCLKSGYLLLFNHQGKSVFHVRIFDRSSCEINYAPSIYQEIEEPVTEDDRTPAMIETEVRYAPGGYLKRLNSSSGARDPKKPFVTEEIGDDNDDDSLQKVHKLTRVLRKSYQTHLGTVDSWQPLNTIFCNATGIGGYGSVRLKNKEGKMWKMELTKYRSKTIGRKILPHLTGGWKCFWKANGMKIGDIFEIRHAKGNLLNVIKKQKSIEVEGLANCY